MVQYQVSIDGVTFDELNQVSGATTINPFGDRFICEFLDNEGNKFEQVGVDNSVEIFARDPTPANQADNSFSSIFEGYVVQADEGEEGARDSLEVTIYSFDQIIRNERVSNDQSGNTIATALENIIKTDTPVAYVSGNVSVGDNRTLNRPLQGLTVEEALRVLSLRSENENYGVNDSREFFFRQRVESAGKKDITDSDVTNYSVPERGKESKNEVTVNYNQDNDRVEVSNGSNQLNVQDSLGTQDPVGFPDEISRPSITDRQEALAEGREFLRQRENTLAGRVTVVGDTDFLNNDVGDTVNVTITPRGIDDEFVLVGKEVDYVRNEISFDIIQKRGDQDSLLKAIGQQLKREELSGTDQGTPSDKVTQTSVRADIEQSYSGVTAQSKKVTTICRNQLRESWLDNESVEIATAVLGNGDTVLRSDTSVPNQVNTSSVSLSTNGSDALDVSFSLTGDGNIIGFRDTNGDLLFIALIDEATDPNGTLTLKINDGETDKSVLTNTGQEAMRDLFRGDASLIATQAEYGDSGTEPQESDTTINTQTTQSYSDALIQKTDTTTEWKNDTSISNTDRVYIENGKLKLAQSAYLAEGENSSPSQTISDDTYSGGEAALDLDGAASNVVSASFTTEYDLLANDWGVAVREDKDADTGTGNVYKIFVDGSEVGLDSSANLLNWEKRIADFDLSAGNHTVSIEITQVRDDKLVVDVFGIFDDRLSYNFDNTDLSTVSRDFLNGPELYPTTESVKINTINPPQQVLATTLDTTYNDISNGQFVEIGNGSTNTANNSQSVTETFSTPTSNINATLGLDGFGTNGSQTPRERFNGQEVDVADIFADLAVLNKSDVGRADYEIIFPDSTVNGLALQEAGQVNSNGDALTRSIFPEIEPSGEAVIFSEDIGFDLS